MAITKRAGRQANGTAKEPPPKRAGKVKKATYDSAKKKEVGVSDLTLLSTVSDDSIKGNLQKRFENGTIYSYKGKNRLEVPPHVFAIAESMYYNMKSYNESQCVIISGESGAGKTEAAKRIMQYVANVSGESSSSIQKIKDMVLATNPLLESFGCAKTLRNNNSSRHGKYLEIQFNSQAEPVGAKITNYLLEKARVVGQIRNERNFHIFYQLTKGASSAHRESWGLQGPESYTYTSASKCTSVEGIDDVADYEETLRAMETIGVGQSEQDQICRLLSAILWIGNINFIENDEGNASISDDSVSSFVAYLLEVNPEEVQKAVTIRIVETSRGGRRGSVYESPLNVTQALAVRDALSKAIYSNLFDWIVERVNHSLRATADQARKTIGILDIYGFEIFESNSFEQICINYVNEKLQQIFIELTLKAEQEEYVREQIQWTPIKYFNNKIVCDLIEAKRPPGIFSALNDAVATAHADSSAADQTFAMRLSMLGSNPHFDHRQTKFVIKHYAGDVHYDMNGMTDKNKDALLKDLLVLISRSRNQFLQSLFPNEVDMDNRRRPPTASDKIKQSANELTQTLAQSRPSYIRTIKPNQNKSPSEFDEKAVLHQVKYLGLQENVRIRRAGFAYRQEFGKFVERFYLLSGKTSYAGDYIWQGDAISAVKVILKDAAIPVKEYQLGTTKVFIKTPETLFALEHMRDMYWHTMAARIQRAWRRHLKFKADMATRIQRAWREKTGGKTQRDLKEKGEKILGQRKERRAMSLLAWRKFDGDYLNCRDPNSTGAFIAKAIGMSEEIQFSCRGDTLTHKLGRSSQRVPRIFLMTSTKLIIVVEQVANRRVSYVIERTVAINTVLKVGLSNLADDWISVSTGSTKEADLLISCPFKTELVARLSTKVPGLDVHIGDTLVYNKKPGKSATIKFQKSQTISTDVYKSGVISVPPGEPSNSEPRPLPKKKPSSNPTASAKKTYPSANGRAPSSAPQTRKQQPFPSASAGVMPEPPAQLREIVSKAPTAPNTEDNAALISPQVPRPVAGARPSSNGQRNGTSTPKPDVVPNSDQPASTRSAPPPRPPPPARPPPKSDSSQPTYIALYDYQSGSSNELSITKDEMLNIVRKETNGWWLARRLDGSQEGWAPTSYIKEIQPSIRKPPPPLPPTKPKALGMPHATNTPGPTTNSSADDSTGNDGRANLAGGLAAALKQKGQGDSKLAGGLAEALRARTGRVSSDEEDKDDDW